jgi:hypothetical protein
VGTSLIERLQLPVEHGLDDATGDPVVADDRVAGVVQGDGLEVPNSRLAEQLIPAVHTGPVLAGVGSTVATPVNVVPPSVLSTKLSNHCPPGETVSGVAVSDE